MMYVECKKLVRDRIPEIIVLKGGKPTIDVLNTKDYRTELIKKMHEETDEYAKDRNIYALADMYEVFCAIVKDSGFSMEDVAFIATGKRATNGGFDCKIFMEGYDDGK